MSSSILDTQSLLTPQQRSDQGLIRALGREVLRQLPQTDYAFTYGSSAMPQFDPQTGQGESVESILKSIDYNTGSKMFDIVLGVDNINSWHDQNINIMHNSKHYSFAGRYLRGLTGLNQLTQYHPQVPIVIQDKTLLDAGVPEVVNIKYGVSPLENIITDCTTWASLYLAGRLHKPVTILQDNPLMTIARELNLHHAVVFALLQLPPTFTELELYTTIASISYNGDIRTKFGAEDPQKVKKLIKGSLPFFRELYGGVLTSYLNGASSIQIKSHLNPNEKIPVYDYLNVPLKQQHQPPTHPGVGSNPLKIFQNYHDIYTQIATLPPEQVILSQPDTIQHRAMLLASLPANTYLHRARGTNFTSKEHHEAQVLFDKQKSTKSGPKDHSSDYADTKAPGINSRDDNIDSTTAGGGKGVGSRPLTYSPPTNEVEKEIPVLPACLTAIPYSTFSFSFGPEVLTSMYAAISPYGKFDRETHLLKDKKQLLQLLNKNSSKIQQLLDQKQAQNDQLLFKKQISTDTNTNTSVSQPLTQTKKGFTTRITHTLSTYKYFDSPHYDPKVLNVSTLRKLHTTSPTHHPLTSTSKHSTNSKLIRKFTSTSQKGFSPSNQPDINHTENDSHIEDGSIPPHDDITATSRGFDLNVGVTEFVELDRIKTDTDVTTGPINMNKIGSHNPQDNDLFAAQQQQRAQKRLEVKTQQHFNKTVKKLGSDDDDDGDDTPPSSDRQNGAPQTTSPNQPKPSPTAAPPSSFLKHDITPMKRAQTDLTTPNPHKTAPAAVFPQSSSHLPNTTSPHLPLTSTSSRFDTTTAQLSSNLFTSTVSDILAIDQVLETPQQHSAHLISTRLMRQHYAGKGKFDPPPDNSNSSSLSSIIARPGMTHLMQSTIDSIDKPNPAPSKLVLPTITPIPVSSAITNNTNLTILNVDTAHNTIVRAVEIDLPTDTSKGNTEIPKFVGWNMFGTNSNAETIRKLPIVPSDPEFLQTQHELRKVQGEINKNVAKDRTEKIVQVMEMKKEIANLKKDLNSAPQLTTTPVEVSIENDIGTSNDGVLMTKESPQKSQLAKLNQIVVLEKSVDMINSELQNKATSSSKFLDKLEHKITPKLPGLWSGLRERTEIETLSVLNKSKNSHASNHFILDVMQLTSIKSGSRSLNDGFAIQHPQTNMLEVNRFKNAEYFGQMYDIPAYSQNVKLVGGANYSLATIPRIDLSGAVGKDDQMIYATVQDQAQDAKIPQVDRSKLQNDPWYYDRKNLPKLENESHTAMVELLGQVKAGALPEGGMNIYNDRRQRWQVFSRLGEVEQDAEIKRLGLKLAYNDHQTENNPPNHTTLLSAYKASLGSKFGNVSAAKYDPRRHIAGVARFDNAVNALQIVFSTKFPLFGASLHSARLRQDILPLWRHDLSSGHANITPNTNTLSILQPLAGPLTSAQAIKTFVTDNEFLSALPATSSPSKPITIVQDNSIKGKNLEWMNLVYDWEKVLKGEYNTSPVGIKTPPLTTVQCIINNRTAKIVEKSSLMQTIAGFFSAGPIKSIKYVARKLQKGRSGQNDKEATIPRTPTTPSTQSTSPTQATSPISQQKRKFTTTKRRHSPKTHSPHKARPGTKADKKIAKKPKF